jgi:hypothetical protein
MARTAHAFECLFTGPVRERLGEAQTRG